MFDWDTFMDRLRAYPAGTHRMLPPCPDKEIEGLEDRFGKLPRTIGAMLRRFNGAELFIIGSPLVSLLRVSTNPPLSRLEWEPEWCIEGLTAAWRSGGAGSEDEWAIAVSIYGGLVLLNSDETLREWHGGEQRWLAQKVPFAEWVESIMKEGDALLLDE